MKTLIISLCLIFYLTACYSQEQKSTDWNHDIEYLKTELPKQHINLFFETSQATYLNRLSAIQADLGNLSDIQVMVKIQQVLAMMGDTHTNLYWPRNIEQNKTMGINFYWFKDGIYIVQAREQDSLILGKKITKIGGVDIKVAIDSIKTLFVNENTGLVKNEVPKYLSSYKILQCFGIIDQENDEYVDLDLVDSKDQSLQYRLIIGTKGKQLWANKDALYLLFGTNDWFNDEYDPETHIYYLQYNKCSSKELAMRRGIKKEKLVLLPSFNEFKQKVFKTIDEKPVNKLVFDMRYNGGGTSDQGTNFINELSKIKKINNRGKLYVLVGRKTFSSAIINTLDFKEMTDAVIVGEETAGKASHFGEVKRLLLPGSGITIGYSTKYFYFNKKNECTTFRSNNGLDVSLDKRKTVEPDDVVELSFNDYLNNVDPAKVWIENHTR